MMHRNQFLQAQYYIVPIASGLCPWTLLGDFRPPGSIHALPLHPVQLYSR